MGRAPRFSSHFLLKSLIPHTLSDSHGALERIPFSAKADGESPAGFPGAGVSQQSLCRPASTQQLRLCTAPAEHLSTWMKINMHFCVLSSREGQ